MTPYILILDYMAFRSLSGSKIVTTCILGPVSRGKCICVSPTSHSDNTLTTFKRISRKAGLSLDVITLWVMWKMEVGPKVMNWDILRYFSLQYSINYILYSGVIDLYSAYFIIVLRKIPNSKVKMLPWGHFVGVLINAECCLVALVIGPDGILFLLLTCYDQLFL